MPTILNVPAVRVAKISIYDENNKVIYKSVYEAAVVNNIKKQAISRCCKNNAKAGKLRYRLQDYYFIYVDK